MSTFRVVRDKPRGEYYCHMSGDPTFIPGTGRGSEILGKEDAEEIAAHARLLFPDAEITVIPGDEK